MKESENNKPKQKIFQLLVVVYFLLLNIYSYSQQGISINTNGNAPDNSSMLDISSTTKGLLIPRVSLTGANDGTTIALPAKSLLVYCTGTGGLTPAGYYYNSGTPGLPLWTMFLTSGSGTGWLLTGNTGTADGTNFLGTVDNIPLNFRVNNQKSGRISSDVTNGALFLGYQAGNSSSGNRNTFMGYQAGYTNTTGEYNTAVGYLAMTLNDVGVWNTAFGQQALRNNANGQRNTALGMEALIYNTSGSYNTAVGTFSTYENNTGSYNTALGYYSLFSSTGQGYNTAIGYQAGHTVLSGTYNTLLGYNADVQTNSLINSTAIGNGAIASASNQVVLGNGSVTGIKVGSGSLATIGSGANMFYDNATGLIYRSTASGGGSGWGLTGNASTTDGSNFLGTTDNVPFSIRVNNQKAGRIDHLKYNTFLGYMTGNNATGNYNSLFGNLSGSNQTSATENVFLGSGTGYYLQTGSSNTAVGYNALYCYGASGGGPLPGGSGNIAIGKWAMFNPYSGDYNVAMGFSAYSLPHSGSQNVCIGYYTDAGFGYDPSYATAIGSRASANANNSTAIGYQAYANVANTLILGSINGQNGATSNVNVGIGTINPGGQFELSLDQGRKPGTSTWTITSDERLKNIEGAYPKGLKEILQLQPIAYHYKNEGERKFSEEVLNALNVGFGAQEVRKIFPEAVGVDKDGYLNFNIHSILVAYVNAIKEQQKMIDSLKQENKDFRTAVDNLQTAVKGLLTEKEILGKQNTLFNTKLEAQQIRLDKIEHLLGDESQEQLLTKKRK